jgi:hypothetical protein
MLTTIIAMATMPKSRGISTLARITLLTTPVNRMAQRRAIIHSAPFSMRARQLPRDQFSGASPLMQNPG